MNLIQQAEWELSSGDRVWLEGYVRGAFGEARRVVNQILKHRGIRQVDGQAWENCSGRLTVVLHAEVWEYEGRADAGLCWPGPANLTNTRAVDGRLEIAWGLQMAGHQILRHEMTHWVGFLAGLEKWGELGHGHAEDPYVVMMKEEIEEMYHTNPTTEKPDVRLRHVSNLSIDL